MAWRAKFRSQSKTFRTKKAAKKWANEKSERHEKRVLSSVSNPFARVGLKLARKIPYSWL